MTGGTRRIQRAGRRPIVARPRPFPAWVPAADLAALAALALLTVAALVFVARAPQGRFAFPINEQPAGVALRGVYGIERNEAGPYRWTRPGGSITFPLAAPGEYRVALTLQDAPAAPAPRTATFYHGSRPLDTVPVAGAARAYSVRATIPADEWTRPGGQALTIEWQAEPLTVPGDPRPLGFILTAALLEPVAPLAPTQPALLLPALALLLLGYGATRLLGAPPLPAAAGLALLLALVVAASAVDRARALLLAYRTIAVPLFLAGFVLFLAPLPFVARARRREPGATPAAAGTLPGADRRFWSRLSLPVVPVALVALGLRLWDLDRLSLWRDEGYTVSFTHLPWPTVLGLREGYDVHPPLYYVLVKLIAPLVGDLHAGRALSAVAGVLTVGAVYALAARLADRRAALIAALVVALSPVHLWYSREARMYALCVLWVVVSYLALLATGQERARGWVALYGVATALALYADMTAVYALLPQAFILAARLRVAPGRTVATAGAAALGGLLFVPWALRNAAITETAARRGAWYLEVTPARMWEAALAIIGVGSGPEFYWGEARVPWTTLAGWRPLFVAVALLTIAAGTAFLARRAGFGPAVVAALTVATFGVATLVSVIAPGFASRTVLYAVPGWALFAGLAWRGDGPAALRAGARAGLIALLLLSTVTAGEMVRTGTKQDYRAFAAAIASVAGGGLPILTNDPISEGLITLYQPRALAARHHRVTDLTVAEVAAPLLREHGALWLAYADYSFVGADAIREQLAALGFERRLHRSFPTELALDLYARPGVQLPAGGTVPASTGAASGERPAAGFARRWRSETTRGVHG